MTISVVIPAFNAAPWLRSAVDSCLLQGDAIDEIVVVNDGSTDDTSAIAHSYAGKVRVVDQENRGLAGARNAGAAAATSEWLFFLDADDALFPDAATTMVAAAAQHPDVAVVAPNALVRTENDTTPRRPIKADRVLDRRAVRELMWRNPLTANALVRHEVWKALPYDESLRPMGAEDLDLWLRIVLCGRTILELAAPLQLYRADHESMSRNTWQMRASRNQVFRRVMVNPDATRFERATAAVFRLKAAIGMAVARRNGSGR